MFGINKKTAFLILAFVAGVLTAAVFFNQPKPLPRKQNIVCAQKTKQCGAAEFNGSLDKADSSYYVTNDYYNKKSSKTLLIIPRFKTYQQTTEYSCGCACALMVLRHFGVERYSEAEIAEIAKTDEKKGTTVEGLCAFFKTAGLKYESHTNTVKKFETEEEAQKYLVEKIKAGNPVLVDWEDWGGHWQIIIGIDTCGTDSVYDDVLIFADPYDITDHYQDGYYVYSFARFFSMWREGSCCRKAKPYEQPFIGVSGK